MNCGGDSDDCSCVKHRNRANSPPPSLPRRRQDLESNDPTLGQANCVSKHTCTNTLPQLEPPPAPPWPQASIVAAECLPLRPFQERQAQESKRRKKAMSNLVNNLRGGADLEGRAIDRSSGKQKRKSLPPRWLLKMERVL